MARDMAKKNATDYRWTRDNCKMFSVKIRYDSGIVDALDVVASQKSVSKNAYIVESIREKLIRDGYLSSEGSEVLKHESKGE